MTEYDNTNKGTLFVKKAKEGETLHEKAPQMSGKIDIEGKTYEISAWSRTPNSGGDKFLSLQVKEPFVPASQTASPQEEPQDSDSLPF